MARTQWRCISSEAIDKALHVFHERRIVTLKLENTLMRYWCRLLVEAFLEVECRYRGRMYKDWTRNGYVSKKIYTSFGQIRCNCPRDRENTFRSQWLEVTQGLFQTVNNKIVALFAYQQDWAVMREIMSKFFTVSDRATHGIWRRMRVLWSELRKNWWERQLLQDYACVVWYQWTFPVLGENAVMYSQSYSACVALHYGGVSEVLGVWNTPKDRQGWMQIYENLHARGLRSIAMEYVYTHATIQRKASWCVMGPHWAGLSPDLFVRES